TGRGIRGAALDQRLEPQRVYLGRLAGQREVFPVRSKARRAELRAQPPHRTVQRLARECVGAFGPEQSEQMRPRPRAPGGQGEINEEREMLVPEDLCPRRLSIDTHRWCAETTNPQRTRLGHPASADTSAKLTP